MKSWLLNKYELGWPLLIFGVIWLYFVPELLVDWGLKAGVSSILDSIRAPEGERPGTVQIFLPLLMSISTYILGLAAIILGIWKWVR